MADKKRRFHIILLILLIIMFVIGIIVLLLNYRYKNNDVVFNINHKEAYFEAYGSFYYGQEDIDNLESYSNYYESYTVNDYYKGTFKFLEPWEIGETEFYFNEDKPLDTIDHMQLVLQINNLNPEHSIYVRVNNIAVEPSAYFTTTITYVGGNISAERIVYSNKEDSQVNMNKYLQNNGTIDIFDVEEIQVEKSIKIIMDFELNTKTNAFDLNNNIEVEIGLHESVYQ